MKKQEIKANSSKKRKVLLGLGFGIGLAGLATSTTLLAVALTKQAEAPYVKPALHNVEATLSGMGVVELQFTEIPKDSVYSIVVLNESTDAPVTVLTSSEKIKVADNFHSFIVVGFESVPNKSVTSYYSMVVTYTTKDGKQRQLQTERMSLKYDYQQEKGQIDVLNQDWSKREVLSEKTCTPAQATDLYFEAVKNDPSIFIGDFAMYKDLPAVSLLNALNDLAKIEGCEIDLVSVKEWNVKYKSLNVEKNNGTYYLSFNIVKKLVLHTILMDMEFNFDIEYKNVPFHITSVENSYQTGQYLASSSIINGDLDKMWSIEPYEEKWTDNTSITLIDPNRSVKKAATYDEYKDLNIEANIGDTSITESVVADLKEIYQGVIMFSEVLGLKPWTMKTYLGDVWTPESKRISSFKADSNATSIEFYEKNPSHVAYGSEYYLFDFDYDESQTYNSYNAYLLNKQCTSGVPASDTVIQQIEGASMKVGKNKVLFDIRNDDIKTKLSDASNIYVYVYPYQN